MGAVLLGILGAGLALGIGGYAMLSDAANDATEQEKAALHQIMESRNEMLKAFVENKNKRISEYMKKKSIDDLKKYDEPSSNPIDENENNVGQKLFKGFNIEKFVDKDGNYEHGWASVAELFYGLRNNKDFCTETKHFLNNVLTAFNAIEKNKNVLKFIQEKKSTWQEYDTHRNSFAIKLINILKGSCINNHTELCKRQNLYNKALVLRLLDIMFFVNNLQREANASELEVITVSKNEIDKSINCFSEKINEISENNKNNKPEYVFVLPTNDCLVGTSIIIPECPANYTLRYIVYNSFYKNKFNEYKSIDQIAINENGYKYLYNPACGINKILNFERNWPHSLRTDDRPVILCYQKNVVQ